MGYVAVANLARQRGGMEIDAESEHGTNAPHLAKCPAKDGLIELLPRFKITRLDKCLRLRTSRTSFPRKLNPMCRLKFENFADVDSR